MDVPTTTKKPALTLSNLNQTIPGLEQLSDDFVQVGYTRRKLAGIPVGKPEPIIVRRVKAAGKDDENRRFCAHIDVSPENDEILNVHSQTRCANHEMTHMLHHNIVALQLAKAWENQ